MTARNNRFRSGALVRAQDPHPLTEPSPRAAEMARIMSDAIARDGCITYGELISRGFSSSEIIDYEPQAKLLISQSEKVPAADRLSDVIEKCRIAIASQMPVMSGNPATPDQRKLWSQYCRAMAAMKIDPSSGQADRCESTGKDFLQTLPLLASELERAVDEINIFVNQRYPKQKTMHHPNHFGGDFHAH